MKQVYTYDPATGTVQWTDLDPTTLPIVQVAGRNVLRAQTASGPTPPIPIPPVTPGPQWSMGYWNSVAPFCPPSLIDWGALTHVIHWVALVQSDGTLNTSSLTSRTFAIDVNELMTAAHAAGVKVVLGLAEGDYTSAVSHRPAFVQNIMALVNQYGYDGVDLDWEQGSVNVSTLGPDLRAALGTTKSLTATSIVTGYNYWPQAAIHAPFDRVNVMTYDMYETSPSVWFNSALKGPSGDPVWSVDLAYRRFTGNGLPAAKMGIGIPFYGQWWPNITSHTQPAPNPTQMHYTDIQPLISQRQYAFDYTARVPTISQPGLIGYDNEQSITEKIQYVKQQQLGGWVIWNINTAYCPNAAIKNPLLAAIRLAR